MTAREVREAKGPREARMVALVVVAAAAAVVPVVVATTLLTSTWKDLTSLNYLTTTLQLSSQSREPECSIRRNRAVLFASLRTTSTEL